MKRYIINIILFFLIILVADKAIGYLFDYCNNHLSGGDMKELYYGLKETKEDVLIFGSSRSYGHYDPKVIEDSLGMTCYNCGYKAEGIIYHYGRLKSIVNRYIPKIVIYDIEPIFDISEGPDERYLDLLKPFVSDTCISNYFKDYSYTEYIKTFSKLYCYNSTFIDILRNYHNPQKVAYNGYQPNHGIITHNIDKERINKPPVDSLKIKYLKNFILLCKNKKIKLFMFTSPYFFNKTSDSILYPIINLCKSYNVPYYNFSTNKAFYLHKDLFANINHLNDEGAKLYTTDVVGIIKQYYKCTKHATAIVNKKEQQSQH